jgi:hypothetical protein
MLQAHRAPAVPAETNSISQPSRCFPFRKISQSAIYMGAHTRAAVEGPSGFDLLVANAAGLIFVWLYC